MYSLAWRPKIHLKTDKNRAFDVRKPLFHQPRRFRWLTSDADRATFSQGRAGKHQRIHRHTIFSGYMLMANDEQAL